MVTHGKWDALLEESESVLSQFRFCLDLNRLSFECLRALGDTYAGARQVLVAELAALLRRMPGLPALSAADGSALADAATRTWIEREVLASADGGAPSVADPEAEAMGEVQALLRGGKPAEGIELARTLIDAAPHGRARVGRRLALAQSCLETGQAVLARGMFAALERELRERDLLAWEPDLAARCLEGLVRAIRDAKKAGHAYEGADAVYERLCAVDPAAAARLAPR
jgi:type VI secretion system protein VasJ